MNNSLFLAFVVDYTDPTRAGNLKVIPLSKSHGSNEVQIAKCATSFGGAGHGIFGPVTPSSVVICGEVETDAKETPTKELYWFGVAHGVTATRNDIGEIAIGDLSDISEKQSLPTERGSLYNDSDYPKKTIIKDVIGNRLVLSERVDELPNNVLKQEDYVLLSTYGEKRIKLDEGVGEGMDRIQISDEKDNQIIIQTGDSERGGPESILIECKGNIAVNSKSGEITLEVEKDSTSNINIINSGKGDVTVQCKQGDTYVSSEGLIKIDSTDVEVNASNTLELNAETSMTLKAPRIDLNP